MSALSKVKIGQQVSVVCYARRASKERIVVRAVVRRIASEATAGVNIYLDDRVVWERGRSLINERQSGLGTSRKTGWIYMDEEGFWWARGWKGEAARALRAVVALS